MTSKLDDISAAIGELRTEVKHLGLKIDRADINAIEMSRQASEHRAVIHKRVDGIVEDIGDMKERVGVIDTTVRDAKAVTDEVKMWKQRGIGALAIVGIAGTALGGIVVGFISYWWETIMRLLRAA